MEKKTLIEIPSPVYRKIRDVAWKQRINTNQWVKFALRQAVSEEPDFEEDIYREKRLEKENIRGKKNGC